MDKFVRLLMEHKVWSVLVNSEEEISVEKMTEVIHTVIDSDKKGNLEDAFLQGSDELAIKFLTYLVNQEKELAKQKTIDDLLEFIVNLINEEE